MAKSAGDRRWGQIFRLRAKLSLGIALPLVLILGAFTLIEDIRHQDVVMNNLSTLASYSAEIIENNLRLQMLSSNFDELQNLLDSLDSNEKFRVLYLLDPTGRVIFAPRGEGVGLQMDNSQPDCQPCHRLDAQDRAASIVVTTEDGQRVFRSMKPILNRQECSQCHDPQERLIGLLMIDIKMDPIEEPVMAHFQESLLWGVGSLLVVIVVVNVAANRLVLRRLERLAKSISGFAQGRLPSAAVDPSLDEIGELSAGFYAMAEQVDARSRENLSLSKNLERQNRQRGELLKSLITAQEDERKRVARELHDELGQALGALAFKVQAVHNLTGVDNERARHELAQAGELIRDTTEQMYNLILALRPSALDDLGLPAALSAHAARLLEGTNIAFTSDTSGMSQRLPTEIETAVYRIFQETLTNVVRHSRASRVHLELETRAGWFLGKIIDDGQGFHLESLQPEGNGGRGLGLTGMQERAGLIGGVVEIHTQAGEGTTIIVRVPLKEDTVNA